MSPRQVELALRKQRLQLAAAAQRVELGRQAQRWAPAFAAVDRVRAAGRWLAAHPEWLAGAAVALLVARPRALLRWLRRGFFLWRLARRARAGLTDLFPSVR